jgi:autotransporter-associated beta strand protein
MGLGYLGNSLCLQSNTMPGQVVALAAASGDLLTTNGNAQPGWYLSDHASSPVSLAVVSNPALNVVVLQQISTGAVDPSSLQILGSAVAAHGGRVILFETWGLEPTWQTDIPQLRQNYLAMAADMAAYMPGGVAISPVGLAWWQVMNDRPDIGVELTVDGKHPSATGAYLAGCVNYESIFGRSVVGNLYTSGTFGLPGVAGLAPATAAYLQSVADQTVLANPWATDQWGYGTNNFLWAYDWKNYTDLCGSGLPGTIISGGGGQPSPSVRVNTDVGEVDSVYLGVLDSANIAGQGRLYVFDGGSLSANTLVLGKEGQGWVIQTGGTLTVGGTLMLGAEVGSYGTYNLSGDGILDTSSGSIDIRNGILNLTGGTVLLGMLSLETGGSFADTSNSALILSGSQSGVSVESGTMIVNSQVSGIGGLTKTGTGALIFSNANTSSGVTNINAGSVIVSGALLGSTTVINNGGTLLGSGTVGALIVASGGTVSPGNGVGTLTAGNAVFQPGGNFALQLGNATGAPGVGWSTLVISGT